MEKKSKDKKGGKVKAFLRGLAEKLDKKMQEKAKSGSCCCRTSAKEKDSCCS